MLFLFLLYIYLQIIQNKNLVFPFKKSTIEYLNETKTISDFIQFNIYADIIMGTPKKQVAHFICRNHGTFYYSTFQIQYHGDLVYNTIQKKIENSLNIYYKTDDSSSYVELDDYYGVYSDYFYLYDLDKREKIVNLTFNMKNIDKKMKLYDTIDLANNEDPYDEYNKYIFKVFKENGLVDEYYITFLYGEYDCDFNYFCDNYNKILGTLLLGESPHEFDPDKYKEEDELKINGDFSLNINQMKFKSKTLNYPENDFKMNIRFNSEFIFGSSKFRNETDNIFFAELISKNLCRIDYINENIVISQDIVYSCENNKEMQEKIKEFPTIYFIIKEYNLIFLFNYKELFKLHNNRLYFLVIYKKNSGTNWDMGELFLRKYTTSFNYDSKTISFYKQQVDEINKKTDIDYPEIKSDEPVDYQKEKDNSLILVIILVVMGIAIVVFGVILLILIQEWRKLRKKRTNELKDEYEYVSEVIN